MSKDSTVAIRFQMTEDSNGIKTLTLDAEALRKVMAENIKVADKMQRQVYKANCMAQCSRRCREAQWYTAIDYRRE